MTIEHEEPSIEMISKQLQQIIRNEIHSISISNTDLKSDLGYFYDVMRNSLENAQRELDECHDSLSATRLIIEGQITGIENCLENFRDMFHHSIYDGSDNRE